MATRLGQRLRGVPRPTDCEDSVAFYRQQWEAKGHAEMQPELPNEAE
ncbi:hypothetical protein PV402_39550 [Streptomyces scabiei]|nr:hypothetical protein [Streptomyces scabiei]MDX2658284.1 hypothetical protein [Streptomyces scabiei]MDX2870569.1 hypothetical protein [Streptomyces scabiei]